MFQFYRFKCMVLKVYFNIILWSLIYCVLNGVRYQVYRKIIISNLDRQLVKEVNHEGTTTTHQENLPICSGTIENMIYFQILWYRNNNSCHDTKGVLKGNQTQMAEEEFWIPWLSNIKLEGRRVSQCLDQSSWWVRCNMAKIYDFHLALKYKFKM